jgi:pyruvate formate lyase activating enzyme
MAATIFLQGCPWRCGYCHNPDLIDPARPGVVSWESVLAFLERRRGLLDGVVFSGGEPTRQDCLPAAISAVRRLGFGVGLHTSGAYPRKLAAILPALDWVGLDIKALPKQYPAITKVAVSGQKAFAALEILLNSPVAYEVRITVDPTVHTEAGITELVDLLQTAGAATIVLQEARPLGTTGEYAAALAGRRLRDLLPELPGVTIRD